LRSPAGVALACLTLGSTAAALRASAGARAAPPARPSLHAHVTLSPERLGGPTSIELTVRIAGAGGSVPPAVRQVDLLYPEGLGIALSGLGVANCRPSALEASGPIGCPVDSVMGRGTALGEVASSAGVRQEHATLTILRAANHGGHIALLFDVSGLGSGKRNVVFSAVLLGARRPYAGDIRAQVPLIQSAPGGPDVALVNLTATIGPKAHLRYEERSHGRLVHYSPKGIPLPARCPRGGFPFAATLSFYGGAQVRSQAQVRCPTKAGRRKRKG
jgi:hypothetical protein